MDQYDHYLNGATERNSRSWRQGHNNRTSSSKIARRRRLMFRDNTRNAPQHQIEALTDKSRDLQKQLKRAMRRKDNTRIEKVVGMIHETFARIDLLEQRLDTVVKPHTGPQVLEDLVTDPKAYMPEPTLTESEINARKYFGSNAG